MRTNMKRAALAAGALLAGLTVASAAPAQGEEAERQSLTLHFRAADGVDEPTRAHASGPISGVGTETQEVTEWLPDGQAGTLTLHLGGGTVSGTFRDTRFRLNFDPEACAASPTSEGLIEITGGTGAFTGATGSLTFTKHGRIVGQRDERGSCLGRSAPPKLVVIKVDATGTAALPA